MSALGIVTCVRTLRSETGSRNRQILSVTFITKEEAKRTKRERIHVTTSEVGN